MSSLTVGLIGLSCAYLLRAAMLCRVVQALWVVNAGAALLVFILNPQPFSDTALWACAGVCIWLLSPRRDKVQRLCAGVAGFLLGSSLPYLGLVMTEFTTAPDGAAVALSMLCTLVGGLVLARGEGGAMASVSGALAMGLIGSNSFGLGILFVAILAAFFARTQNYLSVAFLLLLPALGFFGGLA